MAKIIRNTGAIISDAAFAEAEQLALNYWGDLSREKMFPLAFWQAKQMLAASSSDEIALRVTNIFDPDSVSASWMVFEQVFSDSLQDPVELGVHYFILDDAFFHGPILTTTTPILQMAGLYRATSTPQNNIIRGRIGVDPASNQYFAFFQAAECILIGQGAGGGGALTGAKVPSNR